MKDRLISKFKHLRTDTFLSRQYAHKYAFVGIGQHSLNNLYPVLHYLQVPLKWIVVTSTERAEAIEAKFQGVKATINLDDVLSDPEVAAVFVAATPKVHFSIATKVLNAGKSLFVEKPPCSSLDELKELEMICGKRSPKPVFCAGLQKRYAPATKILKKRLANDAPISYTMHYRTGAYPEGDALLDLFIHPLDLAASLFGEATFVACDRTGGTLRLLMKHKVGVGGMLELSTDYAWTSAEERLTVVTEKGVYDLRQMETLTFTAKQKCFMGVPLEKVVPSHPAVQVLYARNNFVPTMANNQVVTQGFFDEINSFVEAVEARKNRALTTPDQLSVTYGWLAELSRLSSKNV